MNDFLVEKYLNLFINYKCQKMSKKLVKNFNS